MWPNDCFWCYNASHHKTGLPGKGAHRFTTHLYNWTQVNGREANQNLAAAVTKNEGADFDLYRPDLRLSVVPKSEIEQRQCCTQQRSNVNARYYKQGA
jgi:hypothetical protein